MDRELARKRPAQIIRSSPQAATLLPVAGALPLPRRETLVAPLHRRADLLHQIHRMHRRGEIGHTYKMRQVPEGWAVQIMRIRERPRLPSWIWKAAIGAGVGLALLAGAILALRLLASALMAVAPVALGAVVILATVALLGGRSTVEVIQKVTIRR